MSQPPPQPAALEADADGAARAAAERAERRARFAADALDFAEVLEVVAEHVLSSLGRRALRELAPLREAEARAALERVRAIELLRAAGDEPSLAGLADVEPALHGARAHGRALDEEELVRLRAFVGAAERLADWLERRRADVPALAALAADVPDLSDLREAIDRVVDARGRIRPDASDALVRLSGRERDLERQIDRALRAIVQRPDVRGVLSDTSFHVRGGRPVLAVKAKSAGRVQGLVHDRSQSEQSVFIEPREVIEAGNRLAEVRADLRREVARILLELTRAALARGAALSAASAALARLELAVVGARWAAAVGGRVPALPGEPGAPAGLLLRAARHPLLVAQAARGELAEVVPIDLRLGEDFDMLIVTGPNTGGKTLALKTAGLFALLVRCGLPVPCAEGSCVPLYDGVVADIGDEQEIRQSLSTFSSHMVRIRRGLERAGPGTLFLLDELGGGTDPDEGAALGEAILEHLLARGVPTIASTHLGKLKEFAFRRPRAENACVEFDARSLAPLYRLLVGTPGESGALHIAARLGLAPEIVAEAEERLERRDDELLELYAEVREARTEAERVRSAAEDRLEDASRTRREAEDRVRDLERRSELLEAEAQRGLEERLRGARAGLERARALLDQLSPAQRGGLAEVLDRLEADLLGASLTERRASFLAGLAKGKLVYLPRYRQRCLVHKVDRERRAVVVKLGGMKMTVAFDEITWYESL